MKVKRTNRLAVDFLPPFGKAEISMKGTVALVSGIIIALGVVIVFLIKL